MPIDAIGAVQAAGGSVAPPAVGGAGDAFAATFGGVIDGLQQQHSVSNELALQAVTGDLDDIHTATLAATRAQLSLELVATVRNRAVEAFTEIMRMQA